jgi:hypothetical protein
MENPEGGERPPPPAGCPLPDDRRRTDDTRIFLVPVNLHASPAARAAGRRAIVALRREANGQVETRRMAMIR